MRRSFNKREGVLFGASIVLMILYLGYNFGFKPTQKTILELDEKIVQKQKELIKAKRLVSKAKTIDPEYQSYLEKFTQTNSNDEQMSSILSEISQMANSAQLAITDLKPKQVKKSGPVNRFSVSLVLDSEMKKVLEFLHKIQQEPYWFALEEISIDKGSKRNSSQVIVRLILSKMLVDNQS